MKLFIFQIVMCVFQRYLYYPSVDYTTCDVAFTKEGAVSLFILCFAIPVLVNGFCHTCIASTLAKSMKKENQLTDKSVKALSYQNIAVHSVNAFTKTSVYYLSLNNIPLVFKT